MQWLRRAVLASLAGWAILAAVPWTTQAAGEGWRITDYQVRASVDAGGKTAVRLLIDFDFGTDPGHGPYLTFPLRQEIADDPDHWRMLDMEIGQVSSPSGANAEVQTQEESGNLLVRVGNENLTYTGVQTYQVDYTIRGLITPRQANSGLDEFNWNPVGTGWEVPIIQVGVQLTGPADITKAACFQGYDFRQPCQASSSGRDAQYQASAVGNGDGVQVVAGFPAGTFTGAEARIERRLTLGNMFTLTPWTVGVSGLLAALGLTTVIRRTRRSARDQVFLGLTPGLTPAPGQEASVGHEQRELPVTVQFTPPANARPGELGTLMDATADGSDVTATIIDLAVRGHIRITQTGDRHWTFDLMPSNEPMDAFEQRLIQRIFSSSSRVTTDDLRNTAYAGVLTNTRQDLYQRVSAELKWFTANPVVVRVLAFLAGIALVVLGAGLSFVLGMYGWGLVGLGFVLTGIAVVVLNNRFGSRTATGSAMLAQTKGFELYLRTAEADQIKFEEGIDVYSRYLPYAIVFGVAERWTRVFEQLAAQGRYTFSPYWYVGYGTGFGLGHLASSMDVLASTMSSSLQHATAASSGGSGFSGGGGHGGGGGGGW